ncbi:MAG: hypothetical protein QXQ40_01805 [Candidatus Aenigmatarchaeota archaeon]
MMLPFDTKLASGFYRNDELTRINNLCSFQKESAEEGRYNKASVGEPCPALVSESFIYSLEVTYLKLSDAQKLTHAWRVNLRGVNTQKNGESE